MMSEALNWPKWPPFTNRIRDSVALALQYSDWSISARGRSGARPERRFAESFAKFIGRKYCIPTANGSSAILISLQALDIGPGCTVLLPATTWVGCATAVLRAGALPIFSDTDEQTLLATGIPHDGNWPSAILAVHTYASRVDCELIKKKYPGVPVIEDCSHCHGGWREDGERLGNGGDIAIFSFQASKLLTCGEGGCVVTDRADLCVKLASLRADSRLYAESATPTSCAKSPLIPSGYSHGANYAMSELNAALLMGMLCELDSINRQRAAGAKYFLDALGPKIHSFIDKGALADGAFYGLPISLGSGIEPAEMIEHVVQTTGLLLENCYPSIPRSPLFIPRKSDHWNLDTFLNEDRHLANSEAVAERTVVIPHWALLASNCLLDSLASAFKTLLIKDASFTTVESSQPQPPVSIIILTRSERAPYLNGCLRSIDMQTYSGQMNVLLLVDNSSSPSDLPLLTKANVSLRTWEVPSWVTEAESTFEHVARLRNLAVKVVRDPFVAFLDDDNDWLPTHLESLVQSVTNEGAAAAHSWRILIDEAGNSIVPLSFPWERDANEAKTRFDSALDSGIFAENSSIVRDQVSAISKELEVGMVDMGEWLFRRELFDSIEIPTTFDSYELARSIGEDDKLLSLLRDLNVRVACTKEPTLRYRLGGFSGATNIG